VPARMASISVLSCLKLEESKSLFALVKLEPTRPACLSLAGSGCLSVGLGLGLDLDLEELLDLDLLELELLDFFELDFFF